MIPMVKKLLNFLHKKGDKMVRIEGDRCYLRTFVESDARDLAKLLLNNKYFWSRYEPLHHDEYYTVETQYRKIVESIHLMKINKEYSFGIYTKNQDRLIGHISLYAIKRLPYSSAFIGYSIDEGHTRQGIATDALIHVVRFAFDVLKLHRIEAYVSPRNEGSIKVLENANFKREGLLRKVLYINGVWEDHYIYSILQNEYV